MVRVAVVGGINIDVLALVDRQPTDDHPSLITAVAEGVGGKGANQAVASVRLGATVHLFGAVGADADGTRAVRGLEELGIDCSHVHRLGSAPTGRVVGTIVAGGSKRTTALGGANLCLTSQHVDGFVEVIAASDVVLVQLEPPAAVVRTVLEIAASADVPALLDIAPAQGPVRDLVRLAPWVTANHSEAEVATGVAVSDESTARRAAAALRAMGPAIAGVTAGAAGQLVDWGEGRAWHSPRRDVEIVDTAGAGDAFAATLAVLLAEGAAPSDAARTASLASTLACRRLGAQAGLPMREELT